MVMKSRASSSALRLPLKVPMAKVSVLTSSVMGVFGMSPRIGLWRCSVRDGHYPLLGGINKDLDINNIEAIQLDVEPLSTRKAYITVVYQFKNFSKCRERMQSEANSVL